MKHGMKVVGLMALMLPAFIACKDDKSNSSDGGFTLSPELAHACEVLAEADCQAPLCDRGTTPFDAAACIASSRATCTQAMADTQAEIAAGRLLYHPELLEKCAASHRTRIAVTEGYRCTPLAPAARRAFLSYSATGWCVDGVSRNRDPADDCYRMFEGKVAAGGSCAGPASCIAQPAASSGWCLSDGTGGGCGTCAVSTALIGEPCMASIPGALDQPMTCADNGTCDAVTRRCVPQRQVGETCGPGVGQCGVGCHQFCRGVPDGGMGVCSVPAALGEPCIHDGTLATPGVPCAPDLACVRTPTDAGMPPPDAEGTCVPVAQEGEACSYGTNFDESPIWGFPSGGNSWGDKPVCSAGLICVPPADAGTRANGTCRVRTPAATGESCMDTTCAPPNVCTATNLGLPNQGPPTCMVPLTDGAPCGAATAPCVDGFFCNPSTGSCAAYLADGQPCTAPRQCAHGNCQGNVCAPPPDNTDPPVLVCR